MYSREKRMEAVELYLKYGKSAAAVIRELGYPDRHTLRSWYGMYLKEQETGVIHDRYMRASKFTEEQKGTAVRHYLDHGRNYSRTVRLLGYPNRVTLRQWCLESAPEGCKKRKGRLHYTEEQKREAVEALCTRECSAREVADAHEVSRPVLYQWKNALLGKEAGAVMTDAENGATQKTKEELLDELASLKKEIKQLKLERDVMRVAAEIIKKDPGVAPKNLANKEKALLVDALRNDHPLKDLLCCLKMSRSSYFYQHARLLAEDKYGSQAQDKDLFNENGGRYGYRRIHALLLRKADGSPRRSSGASWPSALSWSSGGKSGNTALTRRERTGGGEPARARLPRRSAEHQVAYRHNGIPDTRRQGLPLPYGRLF